MILEFVSAVNYVVCTDTTNRGGSGMPDWDDEDNGYTIEAPGCIATALQWLGWIFAVAIVFTVLWAVIVYVIGPTVQP